MELREISMIIMNKKNYSLILIFLFLQCCSSFNSYSLAATKARNILISSPAKEVTKSEYENFPYSFIKLKIGKSEDVIMSLVSITDGIFHWISSDRISIYTLEGRVVRTDGLIHDISLVNLDALNSFNLQKDYLVFNYRYPELYSVHHKFKLKSNENISFHYLEDSIEVSRLEFEVSIPLLNKKHNDVYYLSGGKVISSIQKIHPMMPEFKLVFFYKT